jgi:hypothetical protein
MSVVFLLLLARMDCFQVFESKAYWVDNQLHCSIEVKNKTAKEIEFCFGGFIEELYLIDINDKKYVYPDMVFITARRDNSRLSIAGSESHIFSDKMPKYQTVDFKTGDVLTIGLPLAARRDIVAEGTKEFQGVKSIEFKLVVPSKHSHRELAALAIALVCIPKSEWFQLLQVDAGYNIGVNDPDYVFLLRFFHRPKQNQRLHHLPFGEVMFLSTNFDENRREGFDIRNLAFGTSRFLIGFEDHYRRFPGMSKVCKRSLGFGYRLEIDVEMASYQKYLSAVAPVIERR